MNFVDHAKGHTPAKKGDQNRFDVSLRHNQCGGYLNRAWSGGVWGCSGCSASWKPEVMSAFSDDAMATRFHIRLMPDRADYVIVWKTDAYSKTRYSCLVPLQEAGDLERFVL